MDKLTEIAVAILECIIIFVIGLIEILDWIVSSTPKIIILGLVIVTVASMVLLR